MAILPGIFGFPAQPRVPSVGASVVGALARFVTAAGKIAASLVTADDSGNISTPGMIGASVGADGSAQVQASGSGGTHAAEFKHSEATVAAIAQRKNGSISVGGFSGDLVPLTEILAGVVHVGPGADFVEIGPATNARVSAQTKVFGAGGLPQACAALEVDGVGASAFGGFLLPRLSTTQRGFIATPQAGLMIWNTTTTRAELYNGSAWVGLTTGT